MRRWLVLMIGLALTASAWAANAKVSTAAERKRALDVIEKLEKNPLSPELKQEREWVQQWVVEMDDIHVVMCTTVIKPLLEEKNSDPRKALMLQNLLAMAAWEMQHPKQPIDYTAMQLAGAQGMLRAYQSIAVKDGSYKSPFMESLLTKEKDGTLESYVRAGSAECRARNAGTKLQP